MQNGSQIDRVSSSQHLGTENTKEKWCSALQYLLNRSHRFTQNQVGWKRPLSWCGSSPPKKHTNSDMVEKAETGRPGNVCKTALHGVRKDSSHKQRFRNLPLTWNNSQEEECWIPNPPCTVANTQGLVYTSVTHTYSSSISPPGSYLQEALQNDCWGNPSHVHNTIKTKAVEQDFSSLPVLLQF